MESVFIKNDVGRTCSRCKIFKEYIEFYQLSSGGFGNCCKPCAKEKAKEWAIKHPEKARENKHRSYENNKEKHLGRCKEWASKNIEKVRKAKIDWEKRNPQYVSEKGKRKHKRNPERRSRLFKDWRKRNPDAIRQISIRRMAKIRGREGSHTVAEWKWMKLSTGLKCLCCNTPESERRLTEDHIDPNGSDYIHNIQPLCKPCNSGKKNYYTKDYRPEWLVELLSRTGYGEINGKIDGDGNWLR